MDFIVKYSFKEYPKGKKDTITKSIPFIIIWKLFMDGSSNVNGYGARIVLISLEEHTIKYELCFKFYLPNNIVEYKTL